MSNIGAVKPLSISVLLDCSIINITGNA